MHWKSWRKCTRVRKRKGGVDVTIATQQSDRRDVDIVVVGAGTAGLYAAWRLRSLGLSVVCLDRTSRGRGGAQWINGVPACVIVRTIPTLNHGTSPSSLLIISIKIKDSSPSRTHQVFDRLNLRMTKVIGRST